ncbi:hypothetical protein LCGC14_1594040 [marine sediment metagenome]|uniref:RDD domain-containing protein n=1 Tax=marine sediment metagenome TaxID=412755 RepID=A0A0F9IDM5_9ZZZZ
MVYAGFWRRALAQIVDVAVLSPFVFLGMKFLVPTSVAGAIAYYALMGLLVQCYIVLLHGFCGQTLGKMMARVRVTRLDASAIGVREALLRSSVDIVLSIVVIAGISYTLLNWGSPSWSGLAGSERWRLFRERNPLEPYASTAQQVWYWAELVVLLFNSKKRALHDFIAGTVVICRKKRPGAADHRPLYRTGNNG